MATYQKSGGLRPLPERLDLNPSEARAVGVIADLVCKRFGSAKKAAFEIDTRLGALESARRGALCCFPPAHVVDALAAYAACSREDLLAGRAVLPAVEAA